jgi:hypothetical protein
MLAAGQWLHMQEHMRTSALRRCVFLGHRSLLSTGHEGASRAQAAPQSLWYAGRRRRACRSEFVHTRTHTPLPTHTTPTRSLTAPKCPSRSYLLTIGLLAPRPPLPPRMRMYKCTHTHTHKCAQMMETEEAVRIMNAPPAPASAASNQLTEQEQMMLENVTAAADSMAE